MGTSTPAHPQSSQPLIQILRPSSTSPTTAHHGSGSSPTNSDSSDLTTCGNQKDIRIKSSLRGCGFIYSLIDTSFNRVTAWLFPNEPEPLDLQSTLFFVAQAPFIGLVFLSWLPNIASWLLGLRTSEAGGPGPARGMRKDWTLRMAMSLSFLQYYLRFAENISIEDCQTRSRSIPFMTAPAGIRIHKVKVPAFPWRSKAEAILDLNLTNSDKALLKRPSTPHPASSEDMRNIQETGEEQDGTQYDLKRDSCTDQFAEGLDAEWLEYTGPDPASDQESYTIDNVAIVCYFHGGGYYTGSKEEHRVLIGPLVKSLGKHVRILTLNYRLAPQHEFPAALVDALSCYLWLLEQPVSDFFPLDNAGEASACLQPSQIVFMGDSAGGGLALSLSLLIRDHGMLPQPKSIVTWSPWLDLTQALPSFKDNASTDCIPYEDFVHRHSPAVDVMFKDPEFDTRPRQRAQVYCPDSCLKMKYVSPLFETNFKGIPEVLIVCGSAERFANECVLMAARLEQQQQPCRIDIHEDMPHIFPLFRFHPSPTVAVARTASYIRAALGLEFRKNDVVIPIASTPTLSTSSSQASSLTTSPSHVIRLFESTLLAATSRFTSSLYSPVPTGDFGRDTNGDRPAILRVNSSSSVSSDQSDDSSAAFSSTEEKGSRSSGTRQQTFDPQDKSQYRCKVTVIDLSGDSVLSFHKQRRTGTVRASEMDRPESPSLRQRRRHGRDRSLRHQELSIQDLASDETLKEWETMLHRGYIPTRIWPSPPL
ncbi:hypothetical protein EMPS_08357 [Entomortierella parvispora]|uniref:Alpha/beta hydrolase fold-3 domain-containing protein n=1 Tax=Entomortierella parvispora TaxID=205924 RepID=A0A9P3LZ81_9FUNG|nr:hypothetical protein EMPS_08357 [Entomortierella parvispora]